MKQATIRDFAGKPLEDCTRLELFNALMRYTADAARAKGYNEGKRKLYYISAPWATAAWGGWRPASWTAWPRWACPPTASAWPTTAGCSASA